MCEHYNLQIINHFKFPKERRLLVSTEYRNIYSNCRRITTKYFQLLFIGKNRDFARLGITITKKNVKSSVKRNKIKRIVRESFRHSQSLLNGLDIIFISRKDILEISITELREILDKQWKKLHKQFDTC